MLLVEQQVNDQQNILQVVEEVHLFLNCDQVEIIHHNPKYKAFLLEEHNKHKKAIVNNYKGYDKSREERNIEVICFFVLESCE